MLKSFLFWIVELISDFHTFFMEINNQYEFLLNDKQLHFLIIGILGMAIFFVIHPIFLYLAKKGHIIIASWLYTFTVILVITFAIEIGQKITNTGSMEFADIVFGVFGFLAFWLIFYIFRAAIRWIKRYIKK